MKHHSVIRGSLVSVAVLASSAFVPGVNDAQASDGSNLDDEQILEEIEPFVDELDEPEPDVAIDRWDNRWGQSLADVRVGDEPDSTGELFGAFEAPADAGDQYAVRLRTLVTPEHAGSYRFFVAGDDDVRLFLNPVGDDPAGARQIAYVAGWTTRYQWFRYASQRSAVFELVAGQSYYLEAILKEGSGGDHLAVAWQRDGGALEVLPAKVLDATELGAGGWRTSTPVGLPAVPARLTDPQWDIASGMETLNIGWAAVEGAEWYDVVLEGGGQSRALTVEEPAALFERLVPDTRYLVEVAPGNSAGRQPPAVRVALTQPGPYPTPVGAEPGERASTTYDRWDTGWWTLTSIPDGLAPVSTSTLALGLETPAMLGENHAARLRAQLTPTETAEYTFHLAADDDARLLFNPEGPNANGALPIAYVAGWTEQYQWDRYDSQTSATFLLEAGRTYYIEAISVHGLGLDHLEVGWSRDGGSISVVPASVLSPTLAGSGGWRRDATPLPARPGVPTALSAARADGGLAISWGEPTDRGPVAFYEVVVLADGEALAREFVETTDLTVTDIDLGAVDAVEVAAWNASGSGVAASLAVAPPEPPVAYLPLDEGWIALGTSTCADIEMSSSELALFGDLRSNESVALYVGDVIGDGVVSYGDSVAAGSADLGARYVHDPAPVRFDLLSSFRELLSGDVPRDLPVHLHLGRLNTSRELAAGVHLVYGSVNLSGAATDLGEVSILSLGKINVSGSDIALGSAGAGLPALWTIDRSCGQAINVSGSTLDIDGAVVAPFGLAKLNGSRLEVSAPVVAAAIRASGSSILLGDVASGTPTTTVPETTTTTVPETTTTTVPETTTTTVPETTTTTVPETTTTTVPETTTTLPSVIVSEMFGGPGGSAFADRPEAGTSVTAIEVRSGNLVDRLQVITTDGALPAHGGRGGDASRIELQPGERITAIVGGYGRYLDRFGVETDRGRTLGPHGGNGGTPFRLAAPEGYHIVGLQGRAGDFIDRIGIVVQPIPNEPAPTTTIAPTTTTATTVPDAPVPDVNTTVPETTTTVVVDGRRAKLRLTFMCRAVDGGDIANDDYLGVTTDYPAGSYVWRVRSENEVGPIAFEVRVGNRTTFHEGVLQANETQFFVTERAHRGAKVHWDGGRKGTASANERACSASSNEGAAVARTATRTATSTDNGRTALGFTELTTSSAEFRRVENLLRSTFERAARFADR